MSRNREGRSTPSSATQVESSGTRLTGTLRLRGEHHSTQSDSTEQGQDPASNRRIRWAEDVVDNEGLGRKSSKVCCIFHKSRPAGESSSESDSEPSSSSDESDSDMDTGEARASNDRRRRALQQRQRRREEEHCHGHHGHDGDDNGCDDADGDDDGGNDNDNDNEPDKRATKPSRRRRKYRPNAYERMPNYNVKKKDGGKE